MNKVKIIKKFKAHFIRLRIHKALGFATEYIIYLGYLLKLSKWVDENKHKLKHNDFYNSNVVHKNRTSLYQTFVDEHKLKEKAINYLEFGVAGGDSLTWWTENNTHAETVFWGFDTYEGLPEQYGTYDVGKFSSEGNFPNIPDDRVQFIKGLFQDTLLPTIKDIDFSKQSVIHLDGDLYSSTIFTLSILYPYLKVGDIIIFDEFVVPLHEFRAFDDFVNSFYIKLKPIGAINNYLQMIFEVTD